MNKTKKAITNAAINVFSSEGYRGATMDQIALKANVVKGTLYYNFKNKEEIFNYIINLGINHLREQLKDTRESNLNAKIKLKNICKIQLEYFYQNKSFVKVILSQLWGSEERQDNLREIVKEYIHDIKLIIDEAMEQRLIKEGDSLVLANVFFGSLTSMAIYDLLNSDKENVKKAIETTFKFTLRGIGL